MGRSPSGAEEAGTVPFAQVRSIPLPAQQIVLPSVSPGEGDQAQHALGDGIQAPYHYDKRIQAQHLSQSISHSMRSRLSKPLESSVHPSCALWDLGPNTSQSDGVQAHHLPPPPSSPLPPKHALWGPTLPTSQSSFSPLQDYRSKLTTPSEHPPHDAPPTSPHYYKI